MNKYWQLYSLLLLLVCFKRKISAFEMIVALHLLYFTLLLNFDTMCIINIHSIILS